MKGISKKLVLFVSLALVLSTAMFGTLAYLTSEAKVTNTFTVGDVKLDLDEADVNANGEPLKDGKTAVDGEEVTVENADRTKDGNEYKLIPGKTYVKDPTVTVKAGSEAAYVRMLVTVNCAEQLDEIFDILRAADTADSTSYADLRSIFNGYDGDVWNYIDAERHTDGNGSYITYEFRYKETVAGVIEETDAEGNTTETVADVKLDALFDSFTLPGIINNTQLQALYANGFAMTVTAQAIQAEGFADANAAWSEFAVQMSVNAPAANDTTDADAIAEGETPVEESGAETPAGDGTGTEPDTENGSVNIEEPDTTAGGQESNA